jgi:Cu2+-exporting ATPase
MLRCDHCLLEFPEREAVRDPEHAGARTFCCTGCLGVFRLIAGEGLEAFYAGRRWEERGLAADPERPVDAASFQAGVRALEGLSEIDLYVDGIRCASCVWLNERLLSSLPGVRFARVNYATHRARVRWDPAASTLEAVLKRVRAAGYEPKPYSETERQRSQAAETRDLLIRLGTAFFLSSQLMIYSIALYAGYFQGIGPSLRRTMEAIELALTLPVFLYSGAPFLRAAARGLRRLRFEMDALIVLGSGAALLYSVWQMARGGEVYFDTAAMIVTLVLAGRYVEARARARASDTVARLARLVPATARVVEGGAEAARARRARGEGAPAVRVVPISEVRVGDRVEVVPGERVPLDGIVVEGRSEVDEALVTGEARPVGKEPGAAVIGGTMNLHGAFTLEVTRVGAETILAGIIRAVERAQEQKPRIQALADRVTGVFVPAILILALATTAGWFLHGASAPQAFMTGVAVVVIACPCSLGLATPIAVLRATGAAAARGLLVKGADVLESAARVTHVVLDKTGTLTRGRPTLREVVVLAPALDRETVIGLAAAVERRSEHSLARAVMEAARGAPSAGEVTDFEAVPGQGISGRVAGRQVLLGNRALLGAAGVAVPPAAAARACGFEEEGDTVVHLALDGRLAALLVVADVLRPEAPEAIAALRGLGADVSIVSGDGAVTTRAVAARAGIGVAIAEASPVAKSEEVARLEAGGAHVLMVGDGINDAPALTRAAVGVAMGRGTDLTMESADAVLARDDLRSIAGLVRIGRRTRSVIRQNVFWAFFYNVVAIPLAVAGVLHPIVAAAAMASSSLFVVGNSLRVRSWT